MLCTECGKRPATVHVTKIINGEATQAHLCSECAQKSGEYAAMFKPSFSVNEFLSSMFSSFPGMVPAEAPQESHGPVCGFCGQSYRDFASRGRFGCAQCYDAFKDQLDPIMRRIHGSTGHTGKIPARQGESLQLRRQLDHLRHELAEAVRSENFERAAELRDRIREMEKKGEA